MECGIKYILPKHLRLNKKEERISKKALKEARGWFLLGLSHGVIALGILLLYNQIK